MGKDDPRPRVVFDCMLYINLAVEAAAAYLISRDKDLLDLTTGHTDECKDFRRRFKFLKIVVPEEFLERVFRNGATR